MPRGTDYGQWLRKKNRMRSGKLTPAAAAADYSGYPAIGSGGFKDISVLKLTLMAGQMGSHPKISLALASAQEIRNELYEWITSYSQREKAKGLGFEQFKSNWRVFRVWCPLQVRLAAEEIFWELGDPYRKLITGFAPLK